MIQPTQPGSMQPTPPVTGKTREELEAGLVAFKAKVRENYIAFFGEPPPLEDPNHPGYARPTTREEYFERYINTRAELKATQAELTAARSEASLATAALAEAQKIIDSSCLDWAEDHTAAQNAALKMGVSVEHVEGNKYGVPGIMELVDMMAAQHESRLAATTATLATATAQLATARTTNEDLRLLCVDRDYHFEKTIALESALAAATAQLATAEARWHELSILYAEDQLSIAATTAELGRANEDTRRIDFLEQVLCYAMVCLPNKRAMESLSNEGLGWRDGELRRAIDKSISAARPTSA